MTIIYAVIDDEGETDSVWSTFDKAVSRANSGCYQVFTYQVDALHCPDPVYNSCKGLGHDHP